jgi:hypothetical protein
MTEILPACGPIPHTSIDDLAQANNPSSSSSSPAFAGSGGYDATSQPSNGKGPGGDGQYAMYNGQRQPEAGNGRSEPAAQDSQSHPPEADDMVDGRADEEALW